jgi:hypothetical protein
MATNFEEFAKGWKGGIIVTQGTIDTWRSQLNEVGAKKFKSHLWDKNNKKTTVKYDIKSQTFYEPCTQRFIKSHDEMVIHTGKFEGTSRWGKLFLWMYEEGVPDAVINATMDFLGKARHQLKQNIGKATKKPQQLPNDSPLGAMFKAVFDKMEKENMSEELRPEFLKFFLDELLGDA